MTTNSELITLPPADTSEANLPSIPAHFTAPALEAFYKQVEAEVTAEVPDVETPEGDRACATGGRSIDAGRNPCHAGEHPYPLRIGIHHKRFCAPCAH